ncbi:ubiquitin carboxyl-terminal hydrolase isozyme L3 [Planococcus citri]|uniref:ubiquitin carboxyl-terminal hydrolase isozyme L3 n=1 Tax=Planococcus citri TaxID=170843 RepID=UPI0031F81C3F
MAWLCLESNPDVFTKMIGELGVPDTWEVCDVYGLDDDLLGMVPQPVLAIMLLYPVNEKVEEFEKEQVEKAVKNNEKVPDSLVYFKQYVSNACGTVALIHSIANNLDRIDLADGPIKNFINSIRGLSPEEAGKLLQQSEISQVHDKVAREGQTKAPDPNESANFHYVAFVEKDGCLFELDGRKPLPINHGPTTKETLLQDSVREVKKYVASDPQNPLFNVLALTAKLL